MFSFKVADKEYKVKFGYRVLCETDLIDRFVMMQNTMDDEHAFKSMTMIVAEMLLVGLQKYHSDEFGWTTESEKQQKIYAALDLMDEYEDESTEEHPQNAYELFEDLQEELSKNGFLSQITKAGAEAAEKQDATVIPQDHKKKSKN